MSGHRTNGIFFDNVLITRDPKVAESFGTKTWKVTADAEKAKEAAQKSSILGTPIKMLEDGVESISTVMVGAGIPKEYTLPAMVVTFALLVGTSIMFCCSGDSDDIAGMESDEEGDVGGAAEPATVPAPEPEKEPETTAAEQQEKATEAKQGKKEGKGKGKAKKRAD